MRYIKHFENKSQDVIDLDYIEDIIVPLEDIGVKRSKDSYMHNFKQMYTQLSGTKGIWYIIRTANPKYIILTFAINYNSYTNDVIEELDSIKNKIKNKRYDLERAIEKYTVSDSDYKMHTIIEIKFDIIKK